MKRIAYIGHSYGAQFGAILGAVENRIKTLVLVGGAPDLACIYLESDDPDFKAFRETFTKEQIDAYIKDVGRFDAVNFIAYAAPKTILFQYARFERYFGEKAMQRFSEAAHEPKAVNFYNCGHELNDPRALLDRAAWLRDRIGIKPITKR